MDCGEGPFCKTKLIFISQYANHNKHFDQLDNLSGLPINVQNNVTSTSF